ncbi:MAG: hypothetical protein PHD86_03690 [Kiritimatiellae bacterium]|nr:hypothetical protein [Kiritimatiellia bacterium]
MKLVKIGLFVLLVIVSAAEVFAQADIVTNIAYAKRDEDLDYFPDDTFYYYEVRGRITSQNYGTNMVDFYIQDTNDNVGIWVRSTDYSLYSSTFTTGKEIKVIGYIEQYNGVRYIFPEYSGDLTITDPTPRAINPVTISISDILADPESLECTLVRITNATISGSIPAYGRSATLSISDGTSLDLRINSATDVDGQLTPTNAADYVGILSQWDTSTNLPNSGYQLLLRSCADIMQSAGEEEPQLVLTPSSVTVKADRPVNVIVTGQDRNGEDLLNLSVVQDIAGSSFTTLDSRNKLFSWTPGLSDAGTIHTAVFAVTDGVYTNTAELVVTVSGLYPGGYAWINEFHYDNTGEDVNEGVELAGAAGIILDDYDIVLYNGGTGLAYYTNHCTGTIDDEGNGFGAVWFAVPSTPGMQNGSPDGVALVHDTYGLLDFLSYEGTFTAVGGPADGVESFDVGVSEDAVALDFSLQLIGDGTNYEAFAWTGPIAETRGELNSPDQIVGGTVDASVSFSGLGLSPDFPGTNVFDIVCTISPNSEASGVAATAYYSVDGGTTNSIGMSPSGEDYTTDSQVAGQPAGAVVSYWVVATFSGAGSNSPSYSVTNTYTSVDLGGLETFANFSYTGSSYTNGTFLGQDGSTWTFTKCAGQVPITAETPLLGKDQTPPASIESGTIGGGIGTLSFDLKKAFSTDYNLEVYVNDNLITNVTGGTGGVDSSGDIEVEVAGDFVLKFLQPGGAGQVAIDNIAWTKPDPNAPSLAITNPVTSSLSVSNEISSYMVEGSASTSMVGQISWTNSLTGASGATAAGVSWSQNVALNVGVNVITFSGTNNVGAAASDSVTITRASLPLDSDIIISQYVETDSGTMPKGIELWNVSGSEIAFDGTANLLTVKYGANGNLPTVTVVSVNSGTLAAGDVLVVGTTNMNPDVAFAFQFNGNDSLEIALGGVVQDVFGDPGVDPGVAWTNNGVSSKDQNIQLKEGITTGDADGWTDPSLRFEFVGTGSDMTGFGVAPGVAGMSVTITNPAAASLTVSNDVATYTVQGTASSNAVGQLSWTNALTGASGTIAAATVWSIADIALNVGDNLITVSGTNAEEVAASDSVTITRELAPPVIQAASGVASEQFNANWLASDGATGYYLDVATNEAFAGGGGGGNLMSNAGFETGDSTDWDKFEAGYSVVTASPQEGTYAVECVATATRDLMQAVDITGDGVTEYEISYWYRVTAGDGTDVRIWATWAAGGVVSGDSLTQNVYNTSTADWTKQTYHVVPQSGASTLNFEVRTYTGATAYFDNFFVGVPGGGGGSDFVPGYQNRDVGNVTTYAVTGLTEGVTYHYRVRAYNDTVTTINSGVTNVTTGASTTPEITGFSVPAGATATVTLTTTINGETYALEYTTDPTASPVVWTEADSDVGDGGELILTDASPSDVMRIYRVVLQ